MERKNKLPAYLAIAGTMGVGKTTTAKLLADFLPDSKLLEENFVQNQFLPRFYKNMKRWAFHSQAFFLLEKVRQTLTAENFLGENKLVIQDTPIIQDVQSYAKAQFILGNMDEAEFGLYTKIYALFARRLPQPDLIVYLEASLPTLFERLKKRDREFEKGISLKYLELLDKLNQKWRRQTKADLLVVSTDGLDEKAVAGKVVRFLSQKGAMGFLPGGLDKWLTLEQWMGLKKARAVIVCGSVGVGKTFIAQKLARYLPADYFSSDEIRYQLIGRDYSLGEKAVLASRRKVYELMLERALESLEKGRRVVLDATFLDEKRRRFCSLFQKKGFLVALIGVVAKESVVKKRIELRVKLKETTKKYQPAWDAFYWTKEGLQKGAFTYPQKGEAEIVFELENND